MARKWTCIKLPIQPFFFFPGIFLTPDSVELLLYEEEADDVLRWLWSKHSNPSGFKWNQFGELSTSSNLSWMSLRWLWTPGS